MTDEKILVSKEWLIELQESINKLRETAVNIEHSTGCLLRPDLRVAIEDCVILGDSITNFTNQND